MYSCGLGEGGWRVGQGASVDTRQRCSWTWSALLKLMKPLSVQRMLGVCRGCPSRISGLSHCDNSGLWPELENHNLLSELDSRAAMPIFGYAGLRVPVHAVGALITAQNMQRLLEGTRADKMLLALTLP